MVLIFKIAIRAHKLVGSVSKRLLSHRSLDLLSCTWGCQVTIFMSFAKIRLIYKNYHCKVIKCTMLKNLLVCVIPLRARRYVIHKTLNKIIILLIYNGLELPFGATWVVSLCLIILKVINLEKQVQKEAIHIFPLTLKIPN